ncbi:homogentisate 1,2-dioxygenase [Acephala macrosclerotiorum]|nr:homogentisate 1,2-dioxygenase [Acephala macrosclerotiorum]
MCMPGATARGHHATVSTPQDPYQYQVGFNNRFATEALPGTLPIGRNTPQRCKYDLFSEQLNGTAFISSRASLQNAWFYRIRPSVAHGPLSKLEDNAVLQGNFSSTNSKVEYSPMGNVWNAFSLPQETEKVDFVQGLKTVCGHGDATTKEGLAIHMYMANTSMTNKAFCNNDGDMLIVPQQGRLDIQTEFGRMMVRPGEIVVIQAGIRFKVSLPDGPIRGYIQEIFGSHYELPELGPIGSNGMALPRDFEIPVASFDIDQSDWVIVYKLGGQLWSCTQDHTPFDVVAWHGNYAPYKYALERFINSATVDKEQSDPSIYCVLLAKSKVPGVNLTEFLVFTEKWAVTRDTFRPPYYHRNVNTEIMGMVYGEWYGTSHPLEPGGLSYEPALMPHGESIEKWREATTVELKEQRVSENSIAFMFHIHPHVAITEYALKRCPNIYDAPVDMWDNIQGSFLDHLEQIDADLKAAGLPVLGLSDAAKAAEVEMKQEDPEDELTNRAEYVVVNGEK